ncbi:MAG: glycosyltransferase [Cytophagaceae bacterium]
MRLKSQPLVSIVTPVYNCEKYLAECIESVLAQTYTNWEYIIVNNCSTDRTLEIAQKYAEKDKRIQICCNKKFLNIVQNHNYSLTLIAPRSKYCKMLHADDWLFPECLEKMVEIAEKYPSVGIVGSYRLDDVKVNCDGLPYLSNVIPGKEICRSTLLNGIYVFGSPTTVLFRSELIRRKKPFFNENNFHFDKEACFDILKDSDFGFVHQVLSFTRRENETNTTFAKWFNTYILGDLIILKKYGPLYLSREEYKRLLKKHLNIYYRFLGKSMLRFREKKFWDFHKKGLKELGIPISISKLSVNVFTVLYNRILDSLKI